MAILERRRLRANGSGAQLYLKTGFVDQFGFPLRRDADVVVQLVPHRAVILLPVDVDEPTEYPLTVPHPQRTDPKVDLSELPIDPIDGEAGSSELSDFEEGDS